MVVEPSQQDLLRRQPQELLQSLVFFQQTIEFRVELDVYFSEQTAADDLPDKTKDKMLADFNDVTSTDVDNGATDALGRLNDDVVVLAHLKSIEVLGLLAGQVQDPFIDSIRDTIVDELRKDQAILAVVEHFEGIGGEGEACAKVLIAGKDRVNVAGEFGALILIDGVGDVGVGALDLNPAADTTLGSVATGALRDDTAAGRLCGPGGQTLLGR